MNDGPAELPPALQPSTAAGPELAGSLERLDLTELDAFALVEAVAAWQRVASWAQARTGEAAALLALELSATVGGGYAAPAPSTPGPRRWPAPGPSTRAATLELALRLGTTRHRAQDLVETGTALTGVLIATGGALERGEVDYSKAQVFARHLFTVPPEIAMAVEDRVLPGAGERTPPQLADDIAKALADVDPGHAEARHQVARGKRRVEHPRVLPDGMASIYAVMPAVDAVALNLALDDAARSARAAGDSRTTDQLRCDVLATVGATALHQGWVGACPHHGDGAVPVAPRGAGTPTRPAMPQGTGTPAGPTPSQNAGTPTEPASPPWPPAGGTSYRLGTLGGAPPQVRVTVPLDTLRGGDAPGELDGYGPITPATARALAAGGVWQRLVTDPRSGAVLDVGRKRYRPPADLAEIIRARDGTCVRPGCRVRADACELDHTIPFGGSGLGRTSLTNLGALCPADHALKSSGDFRVRQPASGVFEWVTPSGHAYRREVDGTVTHLRSSRPEALAPAPAPARDEKLPRHGRTHDRDPAHPVPGVAGVVAETSVEEPPPF
ncbi:HNH endonuclease signature motif containing protein [Georgenia faecalis]|uniref:DUF222 domain-containing protein n=1 Tax=Georgenia faecalis TaxID=2483799 RepID=A0ABV9D773_9MICO|nr:HNH endonuclease signature motif containing protein [Georgenia faecalis]